MKIRLTLTLIISCITLQAQELAGTIVDYRREPLINATVYVFQGGSLKATVVTDFDGKYLVKPLYPGTYDALFTYPGYDSILVTGIPVMDGERTTQNCTLNKTTPKLGLINIAYKRPLIDADKPRNGHILSKKEINVIILYCCAWPATLFYSSLYNDRVLEIDKLPYTHIKDMLNVLPEVVQRRKGDEPSIHGSGW